MARKQIADLIEELRSWLPNYNHGPNDYPTLLWRILASVPGGEEAEDMGFEPFSLGWHEFDQLGRVIDAIQDKRDVEELIAGLLSEEDEVSESRMRAPRAPRSVRSPVRAPAARGPVPRAKPSPSPRGPKPRARTAPRKAR